MNASGDNAADRRRRARRRRTLHAGGLLSTAGFVWCIAFIAHIVREPELWPPPRHGLFFVSTDGGGHPVATRFDAETHTAPEFAGAHWRVVAFWSFRWRGSSWATTETHSSLRLIATRGGGGTGAGAVRLAEAWGAVAAYLVEVEGGTFAPGLVEEAVRTGHATVRTTDAIGLGQNALKIGAVACVLWFGPGVIRFGRRWLEA